MAAAPATAARTTARKPAFPVLSDAAPLEPEPLKLPDEPEDAGAEPVEEPEDPLEPPVVEAPEEVPEDPVGVALAPLLAPELKVVLTEAETPVVGAWAIANCPVMA
jgi:hypothetical protein